MVVVNAEPLRSWLHPTHIAPSPLAGEEQLVLFDADVEACTQVRVSLLTASIEIFVTAALALSSEAIRGGLVLVEQTHPLCTMTQTALFYSELCVRTRRLPRDQSRGDQQPRA